VDSKRAQNRGSRTTKTTFSCQTRNNNAPLAPLVGGSASSASTTNGRHRGVDRRWSVSTTSDVYPLSPPKRMPTNMQKTEA